MKKFLAIFLTLVISGSCFALFSANVFGESSHIVSPTAPTYTGVPGEDEDEKGATNRFTIPLDPSEISRIVSEISSRVKASKASREATRGSRPTFPYFTFTNHGKDDPNSPNYTGSVTVSRDDSPHSPDTATGSNAAPVAVALITLFGTCVFAGTALKKKNDND